MIEIREVRASEFMVDNIHLLIDHQTEMGFGLQVDPDVEKYQWLEQNDVIYTLAMFNDGVPMGYCSMILTPHPHDVSVMCASNDAIYVDPDLRGFHAAMLIKRAEQEAINRGAQLVLWSAKPETALFNTLNNHDYKQYEVVFAKGLTDERKDNDQQCNSAEETVQ